jgi:pimeloyl-ACP methyl ester carboxylesterase
VVSRPPVPGAVRVRPKATARRPAKLNRIHHDGPGDQPALVIAHGLYGSARNWGVVARRLAADRRVVAVDMRNHGESPHDPDHSYEAMATDLAAVIEDLGGSADLLGHSMGGKAAMMLAMHRPDLVRRLIVADIAPVAYPHSQIDHAIALRSVDLEGIRRRAEAEARLVPLVADPVLRGFFLQSLAFGESVARWKLNLDALIADMPRIMGFPEPRGRFEGPALFLAGETSDYIQPDHWPAILYRFPEARHVVIPGAGHWLHADAPGAFAEAVSAFLSE